MYDSYSQTVLKVDFTTHTGFMYCMYRNSCHAQFLIRSNFDESGIQNDTETNEGDDGLQLSTQCSEHDAKVKYSEQQSE